MLRNREFRQFAILFAVIATVGVGLGFTINRMAGMLVLGLVAALGASFFLFTKSRYASLTQLSQQIDQVLHGADQLQIGEIDEGELSILHSEITKMTLRIREQNEALKKEKVHLADSLADIAHQLRTPLTSANLILSLLVNEPEEDKRKALIREAEELLVRMDWLLTSLLKLSRLDAGVVAFRKEPVAVNDLLDTALRPLLIPLELHEIELQIDVAPGLMVQGDKGWLAEALQNILKNCLESVGEKANVEITGRENPLYVEITIRDSGAGFAKEELPHLFDRFYRGQSANATGYGIGLALCRMIITRQGGTIIARNHPAGGAQFAIRFPK